MNILEIENLTVRFKDSCASAVEDVSLAVPGGSFTSMVGETGSGKTVTALSIGGLVNGAVTQGKINLRAKAAYVFQNPYSSFNPLMRLGRQLTEVNKDKEKAILLLSKVKIQDAERVYNSYPHEVSGGQRQRVAIAMALMSQPQLLVADEPTTALDVMTQSEIMVLLVSLQKEMALGILFITHDLPLAGKYSDVIYVMQKGRVVERAEREEGKFTFHSDYAKKLFEIG